MLQVSTFFHELLISNKLLVLKILLFLFKDENGGLLDGRVEGGDDGAGATFHPPSTSFCRLNVATNLNPPPSNWLMSGAQVCKTHYIFINRNPRLITKFKKLQ